MARDESSDARIARQRVQRFERRETELLERLAELRQRRISTLARDLVLETIAEVQGLIQADPGLSSERETTGGSERPIG